MTAETEKYQQFLENIRSHENICDYYEDYVKKYPSQYSRQAIILWEVCRSLLKKNKKEEAFILIKEYIRLVFKRNSKINNGVTLYSFRNFTDYSLSDIANSTLSLVHYRNFNDPFDPYLVSWLDNKIRHLNSIKSEEDAVEEEMFCLLRKASELFRIRCMVVAFNNNHNRRRKIEQINPLMWAHYANCHTGFCLEYELSEEYIRNYCDENRFLCLLPVTYDLNEEDKSSLNLYKSLTCKDKIWKYEKEYRLLYFDKNEKNDSVTILENITPKCVYLGMKCSSADEMNMRKAIQNKTIDLYKMQINSKDYTKLEKRRIL